MTIVLIRNRIDNCNIAISIRLNNLRDLLTDIIIIIVAFHLLRIVVFMSGRLWDPKAKDRISAHRDYMGHAIIMQWSPFITTLVVSVRLQDVPGPLETCF